MPKECLIRELIEPLATVALAQPATLRHKYIYALSQTIHQANLRAIAGWTENRLPADNAIDYKTMCKCCEPWEHFKQFHSDFACLDSAGWKNQARGYRNKYHYLKEPPRIELGDAWFVRREPNENGTASRCITGIERLPVEEFVPPLRQQYAFAKKCFYSYANLAQEQWRAIRHTPLPASLGDL